MILIIVTIAWILNRTITIGISVMGLLMVVFPYVVAKKIEASGFRHVFFLFFDTIILVIMTTLKNNSVYKAVIGVLRFALEYISKILGLQSVAVDDGKLLVWSFAIVSTIMYFIFGNRDKTATGKANKTTKSILTEKNADERCRDYCEEVKLYVEKLNVEMYWGDDIFTPLSAEVVSEKGTKKRKYRDLLSVLKSSKKKDIVYLILGEAGAGKSLSLRKLCINLTKEYPSTKKIPIYINLGEWDDSSVDSSPEDLVSYIKKYVLKYGSQKASKFISNDFQTLLDNEGLYFIFDSFDELPVLLGKSSTKAIVNHFSDLLYTFLSANKTGGIIASRYDNRPTSRLSPNTTIRIQGFSDLKISALATEFFQDSEKAKSFKKELFKNRTDLLPLCRNPFYLTMLLHYAEKDQTHFPQNQMELFQFFIRERLNKCEEKVSDIKIPYEEYLSFAHKIALDMQEAYDKGIAYSLPETSNKKQSAKWKQMVDVLCEAKLCRKDNNGKSVVFVHRWFQQYFYVSSIITSSAESCPFNYAQCISENSGLWGAIVLYCEIAKETVVSEIANYCWKNIQMNVECTKSIWMSGAKELVNSLNFLSEAFRHRKEVIKSFGPQLAEFIQTHLSKETDYVIAYALTNCLPLLDNDEMQSAVQKVFESGRLSLIERALSCVRQSAILNNQLELLIIKYLCNRTTITKIRQLKSFSFSFSLSSGFKYLRIVHVVDVIKDFSFITCSILMMFLGLWGISHLDASITSINTFFTAVRAFFSNSKSGLIFTLEEFSLCSVTYFLFEAALAVPVFLLSLKTNDTIERLGKTPKLKEEKTQHLTFLGGLKMLSDSYSIFTYDFVFMTPFLCIILLALQIVRGKSFVYSHTLISSIVTGIALLTIIIYVAQMILCYSRKIIKNWGYTKALWLKRGQNITKLSWWKAIFSSCWKHLKENIVLFIVLFVVGALLAVGIVFIGINTDPFSKLSNIDNSKLMLIGALFLILLVFRLWNKWDNNKLIKKRMRQKTISRITVEEDLYILDGANSRIRYICALEESRIELTGEWSNSNRPVYKNDTLNIALARLDCSEERDFSRCIT